MIRYLYAVLLAAFGGYLLREGWVAAHSLAGSVDYYSKGIAYKIGGQIRLPGFVITFAGGILLLIAAWFLLVAESKSKGRRPSRRKRRN